MPGSASPAASGALVVLCTSAQEPASKVAWSQPCATLGEEKAGRASTPLYSLSSSASVRPNKSSYIDSQGATQHRLQRSASMSSSGTGLAACGTMSVRKIERSLQMTSHADAHAPALPPALCGVAAPATSAGPSSPKTKHKESEFQSSGSSQSSTSREWFWSAQAWSRDQTQSCRGSRDWARKNNRKWFAQAPPTPSNK